MSEALRQPDPLDTYLLGTRSLRQWHDWLTTDQQTGEPQGHLAVPCSRYGRTSDECAWWAVAAELVYVDANGPSAPEELEASLDYMMGLAVNDHPDIAYLARDFRFAAVPQALLDQLDLEAM